MATAQTASAPDRVPRLSSLSVSGYKSFGDEQTIELRPLTLLAGANSSGKSSIMQPLLLLKQTLEVAYDPGPLLLHGPHVKFASVAQMLHQTGRKPTATSVPFSFGIGIEPTPFLRLDFAYKKARGLTLERMTETSGKRVVAYTSDMDSDAVKSILAPDLMRELAERVFKVQKPRFFTDRRRCFIEPYMALSSNGSEMNPPLALPLSGSLVVERAALSVLHLPGLRGNPERTYQVTAVGSRFPGTFEPYTASVIWQWQEEKDNRLTRLGEDMLRLGLTWKVSAKGVDDTRVALKVGRLPRPARGGARDLVDIADVGFGVSQTLPVLVALRAAGPDQLVYLEQPEIHLHPRAQAEMAGVIADAVDRGVRVVVETHSAIMLLAFQMLVAERKLDRESIILHWFKRQEDGTTQVYSADLDENGAFGEWPEDFGATELEYQSRYLDIIQSER